MFLFFFFLLSVCYISKVNIAHVLVNLINESYEYIFHKSFYQGKKLQFQAIQHLPVFTVAFVLSSSLSGQNTLMKWIST